MLSHFDRFARESRAIGVSDQEMAETLLGISARWLKAHGVSNDNLHTWIDTNLAQKMPLPLTAAARARNDFGSRR